MTTLIGARWKHSNVLSRGVLIRRSELSKGVVRIRVLPFELAERAKRVICFQLFGSRVVFSFQWLYECSVSVPHYLFLLSW